MSIGQVIKNIRKDKKISAGILGEAVGKNGKQWVYDVELGRIKSFEPEILVKVADVLGVDVLELLPIKKDIIQLNDPIQEYGITNKLFDEIKDLSGYREKFEHVFNQNRMLWREVAQLRQLLLNNGIQPETNAPDK